MNEIIEQNMVKARETAEKAFRKFRRPLVEVLYDLQPTDNIAELVFNHVQHFMCFYNRSGNKPIPYMYAVQVDDRWFATDATGELHETNKVWLESFNRADATVGYASIDRWGDGWSVRDGGH